MIQKIKALFGRYREQILYLFFGGMTTLVDWSISFLLYRMWGEQIEAMGIMVHAANVIAWTVAVLFAYITNRIWVFESKKCGFLPVLGELSMFAGGRVMTLLLQELMFVIFFHWLGVNEYAVKLIAAVLVIVANYFISKLLVFRNQNQGDHE